MPATDRPQPSSAASPASSARSPLSVDDAVAEWAAAQERVITLVEAQPPERLRTSVPTAPAWTVQDLFAHVVGLDVDVLAGNEPDDHNPDWTQHHVDERAGRELADLVREWRETTAPLTEWMRANNTRPLGDAVIHEQDLRGALGEPGARETAGLHAIRDRIAGRFNARVASAGLDPISLVGPHWRHRAGEGPPAVMVAAPDYDLVRAVMSRRSADQLRAWTSKGDVSPYLDAFAGLGPLPDHDIVE